MAKPVTSPDSARATEPSKPEAVLELRRGARLGSGAGERERERAREEADVRVAVRNKDAATSWLGEGTAEGAAEAAGAVGEPAAGRGCGPTRASGAHDPGEAERDGVLERSQHRKLSRKLTQLIATGHEADGARSTKEKGKKMRCEPRAEETAGAVSREAPKPSPWSTRMVSLHGRLWRRAGEATGSQEKERRRQRHTRRPRARHTGDGGQGARRRKRAPNRG